MQFLVFQTRFSRDRWEAVCHRTPSNYLRVGFLTKKFMGVAISFYLVCNIRHYSNILIILKLMCVDTVWRTEFLFCLHRWRVVLVVYRCLGRKLFWDTPFLSTKSNRTKPWNLRHLRNADWTKWVDLTLVGFETRI